MTDPTRLIDRYLDGSLSAEEAKQLEHDLATNPQYADAFANAMMIDSFMADRFERDTITSAMQLGDGSFVGEDDLSHLIDDYEHAQTVMVTIDDASASELCLEDRDKMESVSWSEAVSALSYGLSLIVRSKPKPFIGALAAAVILLALWVINPFAGSNQPVAPAVDIAQLVTPSVERSVVATITATHNAVWTAQPDEDLYPGDRLTLTAGFAEITTKRGAVAVLEAPATIELIDENAVRLHVGRLVGICETDASQGFLVRTDHADVVDLGTEFGVEASASEGTSVSVFDGDVELSERTDSGDAPRARQTVRLDAGWSSSVSIQGVLAEQAVAIDASEQIRFVRSIQEAADQLAIARRAMHASEPIAYWPFDDLSDGKAVNQITRDAYVLQAFGGVTLVDSPFGKALRYTGNAEGKDYLETTKPIESLANATQYSMSVWCKIRTQHNGRIIGLHVVDSHQTFTRRQAAALQIYATPLPYLSEKPLDSARFVHRDPPGPDHKTGANLFAQAIMPGQWVHLVAVKHDDRIKLYHDGKLVASEKESGKISGMPHVLIGIAPTALERPELNELFQSFDGLIDEIAIYDRALSQQEITELYSSSQPLLESQP
ncbi:MAG: LamG-like jellyroll fold domain-containing protein [Phycisphaeraceae bacterium]